MGFVGKGRRKLVLSEVTMNFTHSKYRTLMANVDRCISQVQFQCQSLIP